MADNSSKYLNSGGLFPNDRRTDEKHPHYTGKMTLDPDLVAELYRGISSGKDCNIEFSMWTGGKTREGKAFLSLKAKKAWEKPSMAQAQAANPKIAEPRYNDDIPF
ncbi:hypothetical protein UFOVP28_62 [uncultured Caudovirales phage]|uniref:Uncharacterized protein n=1 Tax=uncultured Caudovirales phage TaxID=2100421 RepID=A0A6J5KNT5_9CAUD|nr:hypothetical protein UFOVP28_62 [uncultured Caudovirales phage]